MAIQSLLVANRGEIALRIMRTARAEGIRCVAVYSDIDKDAAHTRFADDSVCIGGASATESYLNADALLEAARAMAVDAIHPGYGFLSENPVFAERVREAGFIFIGPSADAIRVMGDKAEAKRAMLAAGVPCVPGYQGADQSDARLLEEALSLGLPVMVKAAAGGGGRGMRLVIEASQLEEAIKAARTEAENAFGSGVLIIEKAIVSARHVEIQVFGDSHGQIIHLGERDCSLQRRHQKILEESPCPALTPALREAMGSAAVNAAAAVAYEGAGTVEFLLAPDGQFYFLEMNTRLQVEHPVTELVTGLDLVALQLAVARGEPLPLGQQDIALVGHAMEVRLYAEDPASNFLPSTGVVQRFHVPSSEGIRIDSGIESGDTVSPYYDPMIAKIIASGPTREIARRRLVRALQHTALLGVHNNRAFLCDVLAQPWCVAGDISTDRLAHVYGDSFVSSECPLRPVMAAALVAQKQFEDAIGKVRGLSAELLGWSSSGRLESLLRLGCAEGAPVLFRLQPLDLSKGSWEVCSPEGTYRVLLRGLDEDAWDITVRALDPKLMADTTQEPAKARQHQTYRVYTAWLAEDTLSLQDNLGEALIRLLHTESTSATDPVSDGMVVAPMHGRVIQVSVAEGDAVVAGQTLVQLEAMKMQHTVYAPTAGVVTAVHTAEGAQVAAKAPLVQINVIEGA
jgi:geranyl-CoA carboxylase alpha subunit